MDSFWSATRPRPGLLDSLLGVIFPIRCAGCGRRGVSVCAECWPSIPWLGDEVCPFCASPTRLGRICQPCGDGTLALDGARAACRFDGIARTVVRDLKYRGNKPRAELLGDVLAETLQRRPLAIDVLVPVPLAPGRRRSRGFNQSDLIARHLGNRLGVLLLSSCLERIRETPPQVGRSDAERRENVRGAFNCRDASAVRGRRVALVDDVMTTGSTLRECAHAIRAAGAARVYGVAAARASGTFDGT